MGICCLWRCNTSSWLGWTTFSAYVCATTGEVSCGSGGGSAAAVCACEAGQALPLSVGSAVAVGQQLGPQLLYLPWDPPVASHTPGPGVCSAVWQRPPVSFPCRSSTSSGWGRWELAGVPVHPHRLQLILGPPPLTFYPSSLPHCLPYGFLALPPDMKITFQRLYQLPHLSKVKAL